MPANAIAIIASDESTDTPGYSAQAELLHSQLPAR